MKILLDHCVPHQLRRELKAHEVFTTSYLGWESLRNGRLIAAAAGDNFDVLLTTDQNIRYQQNVQTIPLAILVVAAKSNRIRDLRTFIPRILSALDRLQPKRLVTIE